MEKGERTHAYILTHTVARIIFLLAAVFVGVHAGAVHAQVTAPAQLAQGLGANEAFRHATGLAGTDIRIIIAQIIRAALGLVGIVVIGFIVYAGFLWMTSEGNEEKILTAKNMLKNLVIGLAIILMSVAIVQFIITALSNATGGGAGGVENPSGAAAQFEGGGALGAIIEYHYPERDAQDVPRNTQIVVTFKAPMVTSTLISDTNGSGVLGDTVGGVSDQANTANIQIYPTYTIDQNGKEDASTKRPPADIASYVGAHAVNAAVSGDGKTFVFTPADPLGNNLYAMHYTVALGSGIHINDGTAQGRDAFAGYANDQYNWQFAVSAKLDITPPQVVSVFPTPTYDASGALAKWPKNAMVQINFNKPINPISASGIFFSIDKPPAFTNVMASSSAISGGDMNAIAGTFRVSNGYETVEFVPFATCGQNSCGQSVYCLPASSLVRVWVRAATIDPSSTKPAPYTALKYAVPGELYDGIVDMSGNSLDGGGVYAFDAQNHLLPRPAQEGKAEGPDADSFWWTFATSDQSDTSAPQIAGLQTILAIVPGIAAQGVSPTDPVQIMFSKKISASSLGGIALRTGQLHPSAPPTDTRVGFEKKIADYDSSAAPAGEGSTPPFFSRVTISHTPFWQDDPAAPLAKQLGVSYYPFIPSTVTDIYQNCFYPAVGPDNSGGTCGIKTQTKTKQIITPSSCINGTDVFFNSANTCTAAADPACGLFNPNITP